MPRGRRRNVRDLFVGAVAAIILHAVIFLGAELVHTSEARPASEAIVLCDVAPPPGRCFLGPVFGESIPSVPGGVSATREPIRLGAAKPGPCVRPELLECRGGVSVIDCPRLVDGEVGRRGGFASALVGLGRTGAAGQAVRVFELSELDQAPRIVAQPLPRYPVELLRSGATGEVLVCFVVDEEGVVRSPRIISSTRREFCEPALRAVACWKFNAALKNGRRVATRVEVPVAFALPHQRS